MPTDLTITIAYQQLTFSHPDHACTLISQAGNLRNIFDHRHDLRAIMPELSDTVVRHLSCDWAPHLARAEEEVAWCEKKKVRILTYTDSDYPQRLLQCPDYPVVLYYRGTADLNSPHILSVVGTRQSTNYGHDIIHALISDLRQQLPDTLIISGLAYGIDSCAHRESLAHGLDTVGVLAHGLDTIYPAAHRPLATDMLTHGGLLTEYVSRSRGDRANFIRRNRIVAGMADSTVIVQSNSHGGSLSTARLANDYNRDVTAFPGSVHDKASEGCNCLIRDNKARLVTSAHDIIAGLGWVTESEKAERRSHGIEPSLFPDLTDDQQLIVDALRQSDLHLNHLAATTSLPVGTVSAQLFELEMSGIVKPCAGGTFHLINR